MKKLLIFMLVLGLVSTAGAELTLRAEGLKAIVGGLLERDCYVLMIANNGGLNNCELHKPPAPDQSEGPFPADSLEIPEGYSGAYFYLAGATPYLPGDYLDGMGNLGANVYATWFDEFGGSGEIGNLTLVPEPATIAMLGLGVLLMRRRK
ncbi:MAG: PEP-CTERM sorting domain-containing protein [Phycisphaerae bacterium]|jgi:hypothetical protein